MKQEDKELIAKVISAYPEILKNVYQDGGSGPLKEVGGLLTDMMKTVRLLAFPLQMGRTYQNRLQKKLIAVEQSIPKEDQIVPTDEIVLPIFEKLKYHSDESLLSKLYVELLKRACDKKRVSEAHPAFITIIPQLSSDEAMILYLFLSRNGQNIGKYFMSNKTNAGNKVTSHMFLKYVEQPKKSKDGYVLSSSAIKNNLFPLEKLIEHKYISIYISHLRSLNLIESTKSPGILNIRASKDDLKTGKIHKRILMHYKLTSFGYLFAKACIPTDFEL